MCPSAVASRACCLCCCAAQDGTALSDGFNTVALASDGSSVLTGDIYIYSRSYTGNIPDKAYGLDANRRGLAVYWRGFR